MRELKFRGYLKKENKMFPVCDLNFNGVDQWAVGISSCGRLDCGLCEDHYERADVEVMQYTGIKDKNDREVYGGDLVTDDHNYYLVEFKHGMFKPICYAMLDEKGSAIGYEIIGNIHENPELLGDIK